MPASPVTRAKAILRSKPLLPRSLGEGETASSSAFDHHRRKCQVCNHPEREAIEELFIHWHSPRSIRIEFGTCHRLDYSSIYRHARAAGLYAKRRQNLREVFDLILERAADVAPTAHGIAAVVRAYSCLTDSHQWIEPEKRVHISNHVYHHDSPAVPVVPAGPPRHHDGRDEGRAVSNTFTHENSPEPGSTTALEERRVPFSASSASSIEPPAFRANRNTPELESPPTRT